MKPKRPTACPCCSGNPYAACCRPLHQGGEAETAEQLMRSRYAAFATGEIAYLMRTLHPGHPDAAVPPETLAAALKASARTYKYTGLTILEARTEGDVATVVFRARVFDKGRDLSFVEASTFERVAGAWRYRSGETLQRQAGGGKESE